MRLIFAALILPVWIVTAQTAPDSTSVYDLDGVVVTAQYEPQSVKKAVFNVRVIDAAQISQLAATNLSDVLNQYLNIVVVPNTRDGRSEVSLFGLDGSYLKILIDNIPVVSDSGLGNNIDLSQINLNDIERIEIIEGSMGVTHGANAVSGVLNIITKKSAPYLWTIDAALQEESVGREYSLSDAGRHIQSLKISHRISDGLFVSLCGNRNDFAGFLGERKGPRHAANDTTRGYTYLPKDQWTGNGVINYSKNSFRAFYKIDYFNETVNFFNAAVNSVSVAPFGVLKQSYDERYFTNRLYQHLNFSGLIWERTFSFSISHQYQSRDRESFTYQIERDQKTGILHLKDQSSRLFYSTGTINNLFDNTRFAVQAGYEISDNLGYSRVEGENSLSKEINRSINNYDLFVSAEFNAMDKLLFRPGVRYSIQSAFDNQYAASLGLRYQVSQTDELRLSAGKSYRTPSFDELHFEFIDSSHHYTGNEFLVPESSLSIEASYKMRMQSDTGVSVTSTVSTSAIHVDDKIFMVQVDPGPPAKYQFVNINEYRTINAAITNQVQYRRLQGAAGISITGVSQKIDNGNAVSDGEYLYFLQINGSMTYDFPKQNIAMSVFYKYNGRQQELIESTDADLQPTYKIAETDAFSWIDASVRKRFPVAKMELTAGVRNLLDIVEINQTTPNQGSAHPSSGSVFRGYGRSWFFKIAYNLNF